MTSFSLKQNWLTLKILGLPLMLRSVRYGIEKRYADLKFAEPLNSHGRMALLFQAVKESGKQSPPPPSFNTFKQTGYVADWRRDKNVVTLSCEAGHIQLAAVSPHIIEVRLNDTNTFTPPFSYAIHKPVAEWDKPQTTFTEEADYLQFKTDALTAQIKRENGLIDFLDSTGEPINLDGGGLGRNNSWVGAKRQLATDAPVFGLGEQAFPLNLRGGAFTMWNRDLGGTYQLGDTSLYQSHPWFISLNQNRAFGFFFDNTYFSQFDMGRSNSNTFSYTAKNGELRYYFIYGPKLESVLTHFTELVGRISLPPLWALGLHQSRWSYKSEKEVRELIRQFREREIPCDVIHLDIHHMKNNRIFTWNKRRFPEPDEMAKDLREDGIRLVNIIDPGVKVDRFYQVAEDGRRENTFLKYPDGKVFQGPVWPGDSYFPDFTDPAVRIWWAGQCKTLVDDGMAGFWNDMNEPAVFSAGDNGTIPDAVQHNFEGLGASHAQMHNVYGMQMARASHRALEALRPQKRPFVLTRAGFSGIQRYAAVWTGDNESSWEHLRLSLSMVLNLGLSGVPFVGPDIGGFQGTPSPELFARWVQLAAFFPLCRIHTADHTPAQEPWAFGPEIEAIVKKTIQLRYQLLPTLYTTMWQAHQTGLPIIRPLILNFQDDLHAHTVDDQFLVGDSILVAPVLNPGETSRTVYLPRGPNWYNYYTGECLAGGQTIDVDAPLEQFPFFVRGGSVLSHWPQIQYTDQAQTLNMLHLRLYAGDGESVLYQDTGEGQDYRYNHFGLVQFNCRHSLDRTILTARYRGEFSPPYQIINWAIFTPQPINPAAILSDGYAISGQTVGPTQNSITFNASFMHRLEIQH